MLIIELENINRANIKELYVNNIKRLATATSVVFIDEKHLIIGSLAGMKLYIYQIDFNENNYQLLDEIDTVYKGEMVLTDLIDYDGNNLLAMSNFKCGTQTLYKIVNLKIEHYQDIKNFNKKREFCHGIKFYPYQKNIICTTNNKNYKIIFIDYVNNEILYKIEYNKEFNPKDICFIDENNMLAAYTTSKVLTNVTNKDYITRINLYKIDIQNKIHSLLYSYDIDNSHSDCIIYYKNFIFTGNQIKGEINILRLENNILYYHKILSGYNMPHGIAIEPKNNLLAVSNYGDNTVKITKLPEDII